MSKTLRRLGPAPAMVLAAATLGLIAPAIASATAHQVNQTGDQADAVSNDDACDVDSGTGGLQCTLRAAIQEANQSSGDTIGFDGTVFQGDFANDTITLASNLDTLAQPVSIDGGNCGTASDPKPCAGIRFAAFGGANVGFRVDTAGSVLIRGLAISNVQTGIVANNANPLALKQNWIGMTLAEGTGDFNGNGIIVGADASNVEIGGTVAADRNVIVDSTGRGIDVAGADNVTIRGNFIGVKRDGSTVAGNEEGIEATSHLGNDASGLTIGGGVDVAAQATATCDHACNVISASTGATPLSPGLDLVGDSGESESAPSAPLVAGNFIGLDSSGTLDRGNGGNGVRAGSGTIGSNDPGSDSSLRNFIAGNTGTGVLVTSGAPVVGGNFIGLRSDGTDEIPDSSSEVSMDAGGAILRNRIGGGSVSVGGTGASVTENIVGLGVGNENVGSGSDGIVVVGAGNSIAGNTIANALAEGIRLEFEGSKNNTVQSNTISNSGTAGISVLGLARDNLIGGDTNTAANTVTGSAGPAIRVSNTLGGNTTGNTIARNFGSGNTGLFIDLGGDGPGNPTLANGGAQAPVITQATPTSIAGTASPNATIRVFTKTTAAPGELAAFLGQTTADGAGAWQVTVPSQSLGQRIAATQTLPPVPPLTRGSTSELGEATVGAPLATTTGSARSITHNSATLNGTVNPNGQLTSYHFEYGTTTSYGSQAPIPDGSAGSGNTDQAVSAAISGLAPSTTYHYRLVATSAGGTAQGSNQTFTTTAVPVATGGSTTPSNAFTVGELDGKKLSLSVPSAGQVSVNDAAAQAAGASAIASAKKRLKPSSASGGPGIIEVTLKLTKRGKRKLRENGKVRVNARITFTPTGGTASSQIQRLKIKK